MIHTHSAGRTLKYSNLASLQHPIQLCHEVFLDGIRCEGKREMDATNLLGFISHGPKGGKKKGLKSRAVPKSSLSTSYGISPQAVGFFANRDHVLPLVHVLMKSYPARATHRVTFVKNGYAEHSPAEPRNRNHSAILPGIPMLLGHPNASRRGVETLSRGLCPGGQGCCSRLPVQNGCAHVRRIAFAGQSCRTYSCCQDL